MDNYIRHLLTPISGDLSYFSENNQHIIKLCFIKDEDKLDNIKELYLYYKAIFEVISHLQEKNCVTLYEDGYDVTIGYSFLLL